MRKYGGKIKMDIEFILNTHVILVHTYIFLSYLYLLQQISLIYLFPHNYKNNLIQCPR